MFCIYRLLFPDTKLKIENDHFIFFFFLGGGLLKEKGIFINHVWMYMTIITN